MKTEWEWIGWIRGRLPGLPRLPAGGVGIGDDAAVIPGDGESWLLTTDTLLEGTHFARGTNPERIGHKGLGVSLSDIAAMGGIPVAATVGYGARRGAGSATPQGIWRGMEGLARRSGTVLAGGDTAVWDGPLALTVTVLGRTGGHPPLLRKGGGVGDRIWVSGRLGGSIQGRHLAFEPRLALGRRLAVERIATAAIDVSDGLAQDLAHITTEQGLGATVEAAAVPVSEDAHVLAAQGNRDPLDHALHDGEDFELLFTAPADRDAAVREAAAAADTPVTPIGTVTDGGLVLLGPDGTRTALDPSGYTHDLDG